MYASRPTFRIARIVQTTFLAALLAAFGATSYAQSDAERMDLVGPVASMAVYQTYEPDTEEPRLQQEWVFDADGEVTGRVFYSYSFMDGSLRYRIVSTYGADGLRALSENVTPDGSIVGRTEFTYDGEGRLVEEAAYDEEGTETRRQVSGYDADGNLVERDTYRDGELVGRSEFEYDGEGRRTAARAYDADGTLRRETTYSVPDLEYETLRYDGGQVETRSVAVENEFGPVSYETFLPDGTLDNATYFTYDEAGRMIERQDMVTYESMGTVQQSTSRAFYEYEFDDVGNWVRRTTIEDAGMGPAAIELQVREIEYR